MKNIVFKEINDLEKDYVIVRRSLLLSLLGETTDSDLRTIEELKDDDFQLHTKIRMIRKANKISQILLAEKSNLKQPDISSFENGDDGFSLERKSRILKALKGILLSIEKKI